MTKKIIIVGAGISGLSAGIFGQLSGFETEIYEQNASPRRRMHRLEQRRIPL